MGCQSLGRSLTRIVETEKEAERDYRAEVTAQIARDKVGVPKLSMEAEAILLAVRAAANRDQPGEHWLHADSRTRPAVAQAWAEGRRNPAVAAEIDRFDQAARQRLGAEGVASAFQTMWDGGLASVAGVAAEHRFALQDMTRSLLAVQRGRGDHEAQRAIEASRQREQQQERLGPRRGLGLGR